MKKTLLIAGAIMALCFALAIIGGSHYMLHFALAPDPARADTARCFKAQAEFYPEVRPWLDSLRQCKALRDTFMTMPSGERHHAYYIRCDSSRHTAIVLHGWRGCAIDFMFLAKIYQEQLHYHVLLPDLHAHGLSEGEAIGMGWHERKDVLHWMEVAGEMFKTSDFIVHGVSMGAATTMNVAGEEMPACVNNVRFVEDCGYTSVWEEFGHELSSSFGLPGFPLLYTTSLLCKTTYGWSFGEAAPLQQVAQCKAPMLFIHGDSDDFVPSQMVHQLYKAKKGQKELWVTKDTQHALSYYNHREAYTQHIVAFAQKYEKN